MGRRSRSPAGQGAEEGPGLSTHGPRSRDAPEPPTRANSGHSPSFPSARRTRRVQLFALTERPGEGVESGEPERQAEKLEPGTKRGRAVCVCRLELPAEAFGSEAPAVTPRHPAVPSTADSQRSPAQTLFLANFSFSSLLLPHLLLLRLQQMNAPGEGKLKRKGRK